MRRATIILAWALAATLAVPMGSGARADNAFYRVLAAKPNATFEDAVRAFHELVTEQSADENAAFDGLAQTLIASKVIRSDWTAERQAKLTRGRVAYMLCQACAIKGGVTLRVWGPSERYAFRECVYLGVWPGGNPRDLMTGGELMGVLNWAASYVEENQKKSPAPETPPAPTAPAPTTPAPATPPARDAEGAPEGKRSPATVHRSASTVHRSASTVYEIPAQGHMESAASPSSGTAGSAKPSKPSTPPTLPAEYVVQPGDALASISQKFYGFTRGWQDIVRENKLDPPVIRVGQKLVIPKAASTQPAL